MNTKKILLGILCFLAILITACSEEETVTGGAVSDVSTLTVLVNDENGLPIPEAKVYLDGEYKGKTSAYGQSKGTRALILRSEGHKVLAEKEGYFTSEPKTASASMKGPQYITIVLESKKTSLEVEVFANGRRVPNALVSVEGTDGTELAARTDRQGTAAFKRLSDGEYTLTVRKEGYEKREENANIEYELHGLKIRKSIFLTPLTQLSVEVIDSNTWKPIPDVEVSLYTEEEYNTPRSVAESVQYTSDEGSTQFKGTSFGEEYVLVLKKEGYDAKTVALTLQKDATNQLVELERE